MVILILLGVMLAPVGVTAQGARQAPAGAVQYRGDRITGVIGTDGRYHIVLAGHALVRVPVAGAQPGVYRLEARSIELVFGGAGENLSRAVADGDVTIQDIPAPRAGAASGGGPGARLLYVTGGHAVYDGVRRTLQVTRTPRLTLRDPGLTQPFVMTGASKLEVDLNTREFQATRSPQEQVTGTFEIAEPPVASSPETTGPQAGAHP